VEVDRLLHDRILWDAGRGIFSGGATVPSGRQPVSLVIDDCTPPAVLGIDRFGEEVRREIDTTTILEMETAGTRVPGQLEDRDGDQEPDHIYFAACPARDAALVLDPSVPLPHRELVRTDPWFGDGFAIESRASGFIYSDGIVGCLLKRQPRLVLRGDPEILQRPGAWGEAVSMKGEGQGIGGLHLLSKGRWIRIGEDDRPMTTRIVAGGPLRAVVELLCEFEGQVIERLWSVSGETAALEEEIRLRGDRPVTLALSLPPLEESGAFGEGSSIFSYGAPNEGADAVGFAGSVVSDDPAESIKIDGHPALRVRLTPGKALRVTWIVGGVAVGDSTVSRWKSRTREEFEGARRRGFLYP
jgi:hypothetical protein